MSRKLKHACLAALTPMALAGAAAQAGTLEITFENTNGFGFLTTPVYSAFHNGSFDAFDNGAAASAGIEQVAEAPVPPFVGQVVDTSGFSAGNQFINGGDLRPGMAGGDEIANNLVLERTAVDAQSTARFLPGAAGPIVDGESVTFQLEIDPTTNRFASFFGMLVHSNDAFFGNDNPMAYQIYDAGGNFVATSPFSITAASLYDAGTEGNDVFGSTIAGPETILDGLAGEGTITSLLTEAGVNGGFENLATLFGTQGNFGPGGFTATDAASISASTEFFRVTVREVAPVPLPAAGWMLLAGFGGLAAMRRTRRT